MRQELKQCKKNGLGEEEQIQTCFEIAGEYREMICKAVRCFAFTGKAEEIFFFKQVKPLFTAEVEFYTYVYHLALFRTKKMEQDPRELLAFYKRQLLRKDKLRKENPEFFDYTRDGSTDRDEKWFTRQVPKGDSSIYDTLMGRYLAVEKFERYINDLITRAK
jgi:hypothetical protein